MGSAEAATAECDNAFQSVAVSSATPGTASTTSKGLSTQYYVEVLEHNALIIRSNPRDWHYATNDWIPLEPIFEPDDRFVRSHEEFGDIHV